MLDCIIGHLRGFCEDFLNGQHKSRLFPERISYGRSWYLHYRVDTICHGPGFRSPSSSEGVCPTPKVWELALVGFPFPFPVKGIRGRNNGISPTALKAYPCSVLPIFRFRERAPNPVCGISKSWYLFFYRVDSNPRPPWPLASLNPLRGPKVFPPCLVTSKPSCTPDPFLTFGHEACGWKILASTRKQASERWSPGGCAR
jgi:hypothetical protein